MMTSLKLIVGLGNPGPQYALTRHNLGFMVVDSVHGRHGFGSWQAKFDGMLSTGTLHGDKVLLLKPMTYMNLSGRSVQAAMAFYKILPADMWVVHDELDLPFGEHRAKLGGGDAGHNGLKSITAAVGEAYHRLRCGIGRPERKEMVEGYVLEGFGGDENALPAVVGELAEVLVDRLL
jgi:PTH1 family peptidyl-tRNA hydrolase